MHGVEDSWRTLPWQDQSYHGCSWFCPTLLWKGVLSFCLHLCRCRQHAFHGTSLLLWARWRSESWGLPNSLVKCVERAWSVKTLLSSRVCILRDYRWLNATYLTGWPWPFLACFSPSFTIFMLCNNDNLLPFTETLHFLHSSQLFQKFLWIN